MKPRATTTRVLLLCLFALFVPATVAAQIFWRPIPPATQPDDGLGLAPAPAGEEGYVRFFEQAGLDLGGPTPRAGIHALRYYAQVPGLERRVPFYVLTNLPVMFPRLEDMKESFAHEVMNYAGGLVNFALGREMVLGAPDDESVGGLHLAARVGGRLIEALEPERDRSFTPAAHAIAEGRFLVPLFGSGRGDDLAGVIQISAVGFANYVGGETYRNFFAQEDVAASRLPVAATFGLNFHIFDQVYLGAGYTISNQDHLQSRSSFRLAYSRR